MYKLELTSINPYDQEKPLFTKKKFEFQPGITVLVGCNGCGKSTVIKSLITQLKEEDTRYLYFNKIEELKYLKDNCFKIGDPALAFESMVSSEGESIRLALSLYLNKIRAYVNDKLIADKNKFIIIDSIDSGLSIDIIRDILNLFKDPIISEANIAFRKARYPTNNLYIILGATNYETVKGQDCIYPRTGAHYTFKDYDDYSSFIMKSRESKNKRTGYTE